MRLQFIVCKVLQREAHFCAGRSRNAVDIVLMPQGLHTKPNKLRAELRKALDRCLDSQGNSYDASVLGYGLCCNGIVGLSAKVPIIVPRAHDCVTLLLGSKDRYLQYFQTHRGVYWYSPGWIECNTQPGKEAHEMKLKAYQQKYGEDNAGYLMQTEQNWIIEYSRATYIDWPLPDTEKYKCYTKQCAEFLNWKYDQIKGDPSLIQRLLDGDWNNDEFLIVQPGQKIAADLTSSGIITAQ